MNKFKLMFPIVILLVGVLIFTTMQDTKVENEVAVENLELVVNEPNKIGNLTNSRGKEINDVVKELPRIDRVRVYHTMDTTKLYSFEEDEITPFAKIMEELNQLEVTKLDSNVAFDNLILTAQKSTKISFYVHEQKENGAIYVNSNLDLVIADSKYLYITYYDIFEVLDVEALEVILNQIQDILELNSNKN